VCSQLGQPGRAAKEAIWLILVTLGERKGSD